jgi:hypothetical protein
VNFLLIASIFLTGVLSFDPIPLLMSVATLLIVNVSALLSFGSQKPMEQVSIRTRAVILNITMIVTLLVLLHYYPIKAIIMAAAILLPVANVSLWLQAKKKRMPATPAE